MLLYTISYGIYIAIDFTQYISTIILSSNSHNSIIDKFTYILLVNSDGAKIQFSDGTKQYVCIFALLGD